MRDFIEVDDCLEQIGEWEERECRGEIDCSSLNGDLEYINLRNKFM